MLVSSRDRVLPGEDADAAEVLEGVFQRRGMTVMGRSRAATVERAGDGVVVTLADGRTVEGSHCLMAVGSIPNTAGIGLEEAGVRLDEPRLRRGRPGLAHLGARRLRGRRLHRACCMLASVAAMQGRIAMWHALGDAVAPLDLKTVSSNVFTDPEIATVGVTQARGRRRVRRTSSSVKLPLATTPGPRCRASRDGFVKLFATGGMGTVLGGVVVAPRAERADLPGGPRGRSSG